MTKARFRLWPRGIAGQIVALVISVVVTFQTITLATFALLAEPPEKRFLAGALAVDRFAEFAKTLDALPAGSRTEVMAAVGAASPSLSIKLLPPEEGARLGLDPDNSRSSPPKTPEDRKLVDDLQSSLDHRFALALLPNESPRSAASGRSEQRTVAVRFRDGNVLVGSIPKAENLALLRTLVPIMLTLGLTAMMLAAFLWWAARELTAPLARFANAASEFSLDRNPASLPEERGPDEVRLVSKALNRMQERIRGMIGDRTSMLAAVSHDLRTPITRMRLRAEFIDDRDTRDQMLRDLDQMDRMVHGGLSYLRDGTRSDSDALLDIASLMQTICSDFWDLGSDVVYQGPSHLIVRGNSDELQRAVSNLVDNALKHGGSRASVRLEVVSDTGLNVDVVDNGPGIADEVKQAMLEPFTRGDAARTMDNRPAGFGLGLAIVSAAAEAHGGKLLLLDATPNGLIARLQLPIRVDVDQLSGHGSAKLESA